MDVPRNIEFVDYEALILRYRPFRASASVYVVDREIFWSGGGWSHEIFQLDDVDLAAKLGFSGHAVLICSPATALHRSMRQTASTRSRRSSGTFVFSPKKREPGGILAAPRAGMIGEPIRSEERRVGKEGR